MSITYSIGNIVMYPLELLIMRSRMAQNGFCLKDMYLLNWHKLLMSQ